MLRNPLFLGVLTALILLPDPPGLRAQSEDRAADGEFRFMPGGTLFLPLSAHYLEPRVGLRKQAGTSKLKLDIGSSVDLLEYVISDEDGQRIRLGADFFVYAFSTTSEGFRLQVEAVDGIFGGHVVYQSGPDHSLFTLRLRLLHLSGHFLDGHYDLIRDVWKDGQRPIIFLRDFGELMAAYEFPIGHVRALAYGAFIYTTHLKPVDIERKSGFIGAELRSSEVIGPLFGRPVSLFLADHLTVSGVPTYHGSNQVIAGVKFGAWEEGGVRLFVNYYNGLDIFSQYYNVRREDWGFGFSIDFW